MKLVDDDGTVLGDIRWLNLKAEGEVAVLTTPRRLDQSTCDRIKEQWGALVKELHAPPLWVLEDGTELRMRLRS